MAFELTETKKAGLGLIGFGFFFTFLGVILFFDRGLLALGNMFCLMGVGLLLGWLSTWRLVSSPGHYKGSISFVLGLFLIFVRWPIIGIIFEIYGSIDIFRGFAPSIFSFLYHIPVIGWLLQYSGQLFNGLGKFFDSDLSKEAKPDEYIKKIFPILQKNEAVHFLGFGNRLGFDLIPF